MKTYHDLEIQPLDLKISPYKVHALSTTSFGLDGGAMFGTVPKVLWSRTNPADEQNRITMDCRCLLLISDDKKILIDTGLGGDFEEKYGPKLGPAFAEMYAIEAGADSGIITALARHSITPDDITDVILTHLHFDHAGGATKSENGKLVPTFKNATYYIQKENLKTATHPNLREKASYYSCNFKPLEEAGALQIIDGEQEILPNITCTLSHGHTLGQQNIWIDDGHESMIYCADLIPTATHVRLPWVMGYDLNPLMIIEEKKKELTKAANKGSHLFFEHDPYCSSAKVTAIKDGADFRLESISQLS
jgi:glyoxylase-like metal-dependent hydrolase (beta-lactamase superfamily II)